MAQPALGGKDQGPGPVHFLAAPRSDDFVPCLASAMESAGVTPPAPLRGLPRSLASQGVWQLTPEQFGECPLHVSPDLPQIVVCRGQGGLCAVIDIVDDLLCGQFHCIFVAYSWLTDGSLLFRARSQLVPSCLFKATGAKQCSHFHLLGSHRHLLGGHGAQPQWRLSTRLLRRGPHRLFTRTTCRLGKARSCC